MTSDHDPEFQVQSGVPIPPRSEILRKYNLDIKHAAAALEIDQCLFFPGINKNRAQHIRRMLVKAFKSYKFTTRICDDGFRIWRVG